MDTLTTAAKCCLNKQSHFVSKTALSDTNSFTVKSNTLNRLFYPYRILRRESKTTYSSVNYFYIINVPQKFNYSYSKAMRFNRKVKVLNIALT